MSPLSCAPEPAGLCTARRPLHLRTPLNARRKSGSIRGNVNYQKELRKIRASGLTPAEIATILETSVFDVCLWAAGRKVPYEYQTRVKLLGLFAGQVSGGRRQLLGVFDLLLERDYLTALQILDGVQ